MFYLKMKADYYRYATEAADDAAKEQLATAANQSYREGIAESKNLPVDHPVRLGLVLNYSVFQCEVLGDMPAAILTANSAVVDVQASGATPPEESQDTIALIHQNLQLWQ